MSQIQSLPSEKIVLGQYRAFSSAARSHAATFAKAFLSKAGEFVRLQRRSIERSGTIRDMYSLAGYPYHPSIPYSPPHYDKEAAQAYFDRSTDPTTLFSLADGVRPVYSTISRMRANIKSPSPLTGLESVIYGHLSDLEKRAWWSAKAIDIGDLRAPRYEKRTFRRKGYSALWRTPKNALEIGGEDGGAYLPGTFPLVEEGAMRGAIVYAGPGARPAQSGPEYRRYEDILWYLLYAPEELQDGIWTPLQTIRRVSFIKLLMQATTIQQFSRWLAYAPAACYLGNEYPKVEILRAIFDNIAATYALQKSIEAANLAKVTNTSAFFSSAAYRNMLNSLVTGPAHIISHAKATVFNGAGKQVRLSIPGVIRDVLLLSFSADKIQTVIRANLDKLALSVAESHDPDKVYSPDEVEWGIYENPFLVFNPDASERVDRAVWSNISMPASRSWQSSERYVVGTAQQLEYMKMVPDIREKYARTTETSEGLKSRYDMKENRRTVPWILAGIAAGAVASQAL